MEDERSLSLLQFMASEGLVPSPEEEDKRRNAVEKLKKIILMWIKRVAWQRRLPKEQISATSATILTYGSYGLGAHGSGSDMDAVCVGPFFATLAEDFFIVLRNILKNRPEVKEIHCVKNAKVPLMRFTFDGIFFDLPYAQLKVLSVPENVDVLDPYFLGNIDETSWKSLSGVCTNKHILQLIPNLENYQAMLRCVKLWAKKRGVYGNLNGMLGGVHLAILSAFICKRYPDASLSLLMSNFFKTFAHWPWPRPVVLQDGVFPATGISAELRSFMPIQLPCSPFEYCDTIITRSTFYKIRAELLRAHNLIKDLLRSDFDWDSLFESFVYSKKYARFLKIYLSAFNQDQLGDWVGWVRSRFCVLLLKMEDIQALCDPDPTEHTDELSKEPNVGFYWGLIPGRANLIDLGSVETEFLKNINNGYEGGSPGSMELSVVQASQLPKTAQFEFEIGKEQKACWRISDYYEQRRPIYSQHLLHYFVGYVATNEDTANLSAGG